MAEKGQNLDLSCGDELQSRPADGADEGKFLGVHFACCDVYSRVYPNKAMTAYVGHCPRCAKQVRFQVGSGGTNARFFRAE